MTVTVEIVGLLKDYVKVAPEQLETLDGMTVATLLEELGLPSELVAFVLVNGRQKPKSHTLSSGDSVKLVPFVGGG